MKIIILDRDGVITVEKGERLNGTAIYDNLLSFVEYAVAEETTIQKKE